MSIYKTVVIIQLILIVSQHKVDFVEGILRLIGAFNILLNQIRGLEPWFPKRET